MSQQPATYGPYSPARQAGNLYYVSGQVGMDPTTKSAPAGVAEQTTIVLQNLRHALQTVGLTMNDVIKTTVYVTNMADFSVVNKVYVTYFAEPRPARATVGVADLPHLADVPLLVEIEAVAYKPQEAA